MKFQDFRIGWRMLAQEPGYSALAVGALVAAFATCFLLLGFVAYSFGYDAQVPARERIYLMKFKPNIASHARWLETTPLPFAEVARRTGMVEQVSALVPLTSTLRVGDRLSSVKLFAVHPSFAPMMDLHPLQGDLGAALQRPDALALTQRTARKLFGDRPALNAQVQIGGVSYTVLALLPDPPANTTIPFEGLAGIGSTIWPAEEREKLLNGWGAVGGKIYVQLKPGQAPQGLQAALQEAADHSPLLARLPAEMLRKLGQKKVMEVKLGRLDQLYFDSELADAPGASLHGSERNVVGLGAIALLILALATINYINLSTVRTLRRQREIGIRKVLGAGARDVALQFLGESVLLSVLAAALGLWLAWLLLPAFSELVNRRLEGQFGAGALLSGLGFGALVGLVAGAYPASVALTVLPSHVLAGRGNSDTRSGMWLRRGLTVFQFATAIGLTAVTLTIAWQTRYATGLNPGFDPAPLLVVQLPEDLSAPSSMALRDELARLPGVQGVAASADAIGSANVGKSVSLRTATGQSAMLKAMPVTPEFFAVYQVKALSGRLFDARLDPPQHAGGVVLNRAAATALGFADPAAAVGQMLTQDGSKDGAGALQVLGIAPDLRFQSLRAPVAPMLYQVSLATSVLTVRTSGAIAPVAAEIDALWRRRLPNEIPDISPAQTFITANYADDIRLAQLLALAAVVALAIAAFGIYVLSASSVMRRSREIVLRKLYGAGRGAIASLLLLEFGVLLLVGAGLGIPPALLAAGNYLAVYVERAPIGPWAMLSALALALLVALLATLRHTVAALRISPARVLRT